MTPPWTHSNRTFPLVLSLFVGITACAGERESSDNIGTETAADSGAVVMPDRAEPEETLAEPDPEREAAPESGESAPAFGSARDEADADADKLDVETAEGLGLEKHLRLNVAGTVPGRLAAGGGIHGENQPSTPAARLGDRRAGDLGEKRVDFRLIGFRR